MRPVLVLPLAALVLTLAACGNLSAPPTAEPTPSGSPTGPATTAPQDPGPESDWSRSGPLATSMPTRTCVLQESQVEAGIRTLSTTCFDPSTYATEEPCAPPSGMTSGIFLCVERPKLTQRVVDEWNRFADDEDRASAERQGLTLEEYRRQNPDQHADGSPVDPPS